MLFVSLSCLLPYKVTFCCVYCAFLLLALVLTPLSFYPCTFLDSFRILSTLLVTADCFLRWGFECFFLLLLWISGVFEPKRFGKLSLFLLLFVVFFLLSLNALL